MMPPKGNKTGNPESITEMHTYVQPDAFGQKLNSYIFFYFLLQACTQQYRTVLTYPEIKADGHDPENLYTWKIGGEYVNSMNILGLVFFSGKT